ncbi:JAB domain-containing protein [Qipengyuania aquimaris]|uniref:JAB domain-containing protein n=1 Tax=Qipengyuania aquimaris TaxID=255984 RepID=UPI001CD4CA81|nr:JAB domain-containing protein [Qipengyuania aquimaris]MCA0903815.1 JAB domain-containing protein [Qipengyuania aquimaris]
MLEGRHPDPGKAAEQLLSQFSPVVSLHGMQANDREAVGPVCPQRWTLGMVLARWLVRLGLTQEEPVPNEPLTETRSELRQKLFDSMSRLETERMVAIFADSAGRVISQELVAEGDKGQLRLSLRQLFTKALKRDAKRMIIAHNHPSGCASPSENDVSSTRRLDEYARSLGITLEDHLIIGAADITSMRTLGLLA